MNKACVVEEVVVISPKSDKVWFGLVLWHINIMISKYILQITFLNEPELTFFHTVKWFHLFLSNTNIILFTINH